MIMKVFVWNQDKNEYLRKTRSITFQDIVFAIQEGLVLTEYINPNTAKYPQQRILEILIADYVYLVPYVESKNELFLKTIIPSRKATKKYKKR
jgi:uncharacterized DUF497 family protein